MEDSGHCELNGRCGRTIPAAVGNKETPNTNKTIVGSGRRPSVRWGQFWSNFRQFLTVIFRRNWPPWRSFKIHMDQKLDLTLSTTSTHKLTNRDFIYADGHCGSVWFTRGLLISRRGSSTNASPSIVAMRQARSLFYSSISAGRLHIIKFFRVINETFDPDEQFPRGDVSQNDHKICGVQRYKRARPLLRRRTSLYLPSTPVVSI